MNTHSAEFREAIQRLPYGEAIVIQGLGWDDYEAALEDLQRRPHLRTSYDCGRLEILSPLPEHEEYARFIDLMVAFYCDEFDLKLQCYGGATWKLKALKKGVEPDSCYYVENAARVIGKKKFDLALDPPPDIVVEIDITNKSLGKFPIYAALGVSEIWRYDGKTIEFYQRSRDNYTAAKGSRFLPGLTGLLMVETFEAIKALGQTEALKTFRRQVRGSHPM